MSKIIPDSVVLEVFGIVRREQFDDPLPRGNTVHTQYKELHMKTSFITTREHDNCVKVGKSIGVVFNILVLIDDKFVLFASYNRICFFFFHYPLGSTTIGILRTVSLKGVLELVSCIVCKYALFPDSHAKK